MSRITSVGSVTNTLTAPLEPAGTMAALALILPSGEFSVETPGCDCPAGQMVRYPSEPCGTTVTLSEYAVAVEGMPQGLLGIGKLRDEPPGMDGPPKPPDGLRVSTKRQGVTGTK